MTVTSRTASLPLSPAMVLGLLVGCGPSPEPPGPEVAEAAQPLYAVAARLWTSRDVPVCWQPTPEGEDHEEEKTWVRNAFSGQRSWTDRANVVLTGWGPCPANGIGYGIELTGGLSNGTYYLTGNDWVADVMFDFHDQAHLNSPRCTYNGLSRKACIEAAALHELGHALGFDHEHSRPDSPCVGVGDIGSSAGDTTFGPYDAQSIMTYCAPTFDLSATDRVGVERLYGPGSAPAPRLGDYNGDGRADQLCHSSIAHVSVDYAAVAPSYFGAVDHSVLGAWCSAHDHERVFTGDFNGDGRDDLLCFNSLSGRRSVDLASVTGTFGTQDSTNATGWCISSDTRRLLVGDVNGDGRDDLVCHDHVSGALYVDLASASGYFGGTDWSNGNASLCDDGPRQRLYLGDFDGDGRADLYCHDFDTGAQRVEYAGVGGTFGGSAWTRNGSWCNATETRTIVVGDFDGDAHDDLLCFDPRTGYRYVDHASATGTFTGDNWSSANPWCNSNASRVFAGDVDADGHEDLVCYNVSTGARQVAFADVNGAFTGKNWNTATAFCTASAATAL